MKITLKELKAMIKESVRNALKEQEMPVAAAQVPQARPPVPNTAQDSATPGPTGQQRTNQPAQQRSSAVREINSIVRQLLSLTPRGGQNIMSSNEIIVGVGSMESALNRLARNQDILMLGKQDKVNQAVSLLRRVGRSPIDSGVDDQRLRRMVYTAVRTLREVSKELGSQDSQTDQMIAQLAASATGPASPEVGGMRQGMAPQPLRGSQPVPLTSRPEGSAPVERAITAPAMQEKRTRKK